MLRRMLAIVLKIGWITEATASKIVSISAVTALKTVWIAKAIVSMIASIENQTGRKTLVMRSWPRGSIAKVIG